MPDCSASPHAPKLGLTVRIQALKGCALTQTSDRHLFDFLVIGSGLAGLFYSLRVAEHGSVGLVTKRRSADSATSWAQGGIAAVLGPDDSFEAHVADTMNAGADLCKEEVVRFVVTHGPDAIDALLKYGVDFDRRREPGHDSEFDLGREGGHTRRRILHHLDITGQEIEHALLARARAHPQHHHLREPLRDRPAHVPQGGPHRGQSSPRRLRARLALGGRRAVPGADHDARHRRRRQGVPLHQQPRHRFGRRHGDGVPRGRHPREHGVHPVPPDLSLPSAREIVPHQRGGAR